MEQLHGSPSGRTVWNSLVGSIRKTFLLLALVVTLGTAIWMANPGTIVYGQGGCGFRCQQGLHQCVQGGGGGCESAFDNCIEGCLSL